jgi:hypothetical protein
MLSNWHDGHLVFAHLKLGPQFMASLRKDKVPVVPT